MAFSSDWHPLPKTGHNCLESLIEGEELDDATADAFKHIAFGGMIRERNGAWVPLPWTLKRKEFRGADMDALLDAGLVEVKKLSGGRDYSSRDNLCREYMLTAETRDAFEDACLDGITGRWVNGWTGKRTRKTPKHDKQGAGDEVKEAWKAVNPCTFDVEAAREHLQQLRRRREAAAKAWKKAANVPHPAREDEALFAPTRGRFGQVVKTEFGPPFAQLWRNLQSAEGTYANDFRCFLRLVYRHGIEEVEGAGGRLVRVQETYRQAVTGRSQAIGGALQNMSNEMKQKTLMVDGQKNYDFESSHDRILLEHFDRAGIECPLLERILDYEGDAKQEIADYAGVSRACVKLVLHPLKMGSTLAETTAYAPFSAVVKDVGEDRAPEAFGRLRRQLAPIEDALKEWYTYLEAEWIPSNRYKARGGYHVSNAVQVTRCLSDFKDSKRGAKVAAHLLQGREAQILYELVRASKKYGFEIRSLQHDGVITDGEIPAEAIEEIRQATGADYLRLKEKAFV